MLTELSKSSRFIWKIDNVSELDPLDGLDSDVFIVNGKRWKLQVYPTRTESLLVSVVPADTITFPKDAVNLSVVIPSQTNDRDTMRSEVKNVFAEKTCLGYGRRLAFPLSELHDPKKGYIVNDSCFIKFEVSCRVNKNQMDSDFEESDPADIGEQPGQTFEEGRHSSRSRFCDEGGEYEDIGGFSISKTQASLYEQIWAIYGHIPTAKVVPISSYSVLVMAVKDLMSSVIDMHQCRFVDLSTEMIEIWEEKIKMAEKLEFNIGWLRERFATVKQGVSGMQKFETELLEHGQFLSAAKSKMKSKGVSLKKAEVQLIAARNYVRENAVGFSDFDMETYLEIRGNRLLDGLF